MVIKRFKIYSYDFLPQDLLARSFHWDETTEGFDFWYRIHRKWTQWIENIKKNGLTCTFKDGITSLLHYEPENEQYSDFILQYGRVIYKTHTDKKESNYKWKGKVYHSIGKDEIAELKNKLASLFQDVQSSSKLSCKEFEDFEKTPFFKDYPWEYENEFRVLINLNKKYLNKVKYIEVDISSFMKDLKVHFGPNLKEKDLEVVELPNIKKYWIENRDKHLISSIQADMNIMKIHKEEIIEPVFQSFRENLVLNHPIVIKSFV